MGIIATIITIILAVIGGLIGGLPSPVANDGEVLSPETVAYTPAYAPVSPVERPEPIEGAYNIVYSNNGQTVSYNVVQNDKVCSVYTDYSHADGGKTSSLNCME